MHPITALILLCIYAARPPDILFDARIDLQGTLAANPATLEGNTMYGKVLHSCCATSEREMTPDGRVPIGVVAAFMEDELHGLAALTEGNKLCFIAYIILRT
jgi:hypothetical protein